jgi:hypothetical protein
MGAAKGEPMREVEVGLRIDLNTGLSPFGTDEVNELIRRGGRVVALEPGGAIMRKLGENKGNVSLTLSGFSIKVRIEEAADA